jgi:hypothetical protein
MKLGVGMAVESLYKLLAQNNLILLYDSFFPSTRAGALFIIIILSMASGLSRFFAWYASRRC